MSPSVLLVVANAVPANTIRRLLVESRDGRFEVEWVSRLSDALERLASQRGEDIAAILVHLFLSDSQGIETFDELFRAAPRTPILVLSRLRDEKVVRLALRRGARDYLLEEHLDGYGLSKALTGMLERSIYADTLSLERAHARVILDSIGDAVISIDVAGNITYLNPVAESMTGWSPHEAYGRPLQEVLRLIDGYSRQPALNPLAMAILQNRTIGLSAHCLMIGRDGHESAIEDTAAPIHDRRGQVIGAVIVFHDVGVARAMSLRMSYLAQHDVLTRLPNRMLLNDRLTQAIATANRHGGLLAVLFADLDHFKRVNDSFGHVIGDQLLQSVSRRLVGCVRSSDTVSRHGGDEFVILLSEITRIEDAALSADKILAALGPPHRIEERDLYVTMSLGIGVYPVDGMDAQTLFKSADVALSEAKAHGRNRHQFFEPRRGSRNHAPAEELIRVRQEEEQEAAARPC